MRIDLDVAVRVVVGSGFEWRVEIFAQIDADDSLVLGLFELLHQMIDTEVVEAEPVDHRTRLGNPKYTRLRIARLRAWCDAAEFEKAKAECAEAFDAFTVLVGTCAKADRVGEGDAHHRAWIGRNLRCKQPCGAERCHRVQTLHR